MMRSVGGSPALSRARRRASLLTLYFRLDLVFVKALANCHTSEEAGYNKLGGSVWESNPPSDPRRAGSPALKAGKVTGPLSPPSARSPFILRGLVEVRNLLRPVLDGVGVSSGVS